MKKTPGHRSTAGKRIGAERFLLFPPELVIHATQMTPQALFHAKNGSLSHRWVIAGERSRIKNDDKAEATRALREMLSAGRLTKLMPTKVGGEIVTVTIEQEGPIAFVESTTAARVFEDDANRCILLSTDERRSQTKTIMRRLALHASGKVRSEGPRVVALHHAAQRLLERRSVVIPFAERLAELLEVFADRVECRRAYPMLLSIIEAATLLHQRQRREDQDGRLIAEPVDFALAAHRTNRKDGQTFFPPADPRRVYYPSLRLEAAHGRFGIRIGFSRKNRMITRRQLVCFLVSGGMPAAATPAHATDPRSVTVRIKNFTSEPVAVWITRPSRTQDLNPEQVGVFRIPQNGRNVVGLSYNTIFVGAAIDGEETRVRLRVRRSRTVYVEITDDGIRLSDTRF